ncbi:hypothetical protein AAFF_G00414870 [Aldrovandia affinis]|uniref:Uncharacterized protein n=1 Tax=Aldrovandia affinis TaxID=143900 RepID=A0AAD7SB67_9TELE|nr:hypothetical protein AAFF_G00414870 [Aldrovandia affinis]
MGPTLSMQPSVLMNAEDCRMSQWGLFFPSCEGRAVSPAEPCPVPRLRAMLQSHEPGPSHTRPGSHSALLRHDR